LINHTIPPSPGITLPRSLSLNSVIFPFSSLT